jgi:hypothetical protein
MRRGAHGTAHAHAVHSIFFQNTTGDSLVMSTQCPEPSMEYVSVRSVVPTLTINERWDLPLDGRC